MTTPDFQPPRRQDATPGVWVDPAEPERPWRTPPAHDSTPAIRRFLLGATALLLVVTLLWSTGALRPRDDNQTFLPAGDPIPVGSFEARFTEAVAQRQYDDTWKVQVHGEIRGLGAETSYAPDGVLAWPDHSVVHDGRTSVGDDHGSAVTPGLTSEATIQYDLPADWVPMDTVCGGFHARKQQKARLGDDGKTWVSQRAWSCSWVPLIVVGS